MRAHSPNESRDIEAAFIHPSLSHGSLVQGFVRVDCEPQLLRFSARNVRPIDPVSWRFDLGDGVVQQVATSSQPSRSASEQPEQTVGPRPAAAIPPAANPEPSEHVDASDMSRTNSCVESARHACSCS